jgi:hypothetical protein
MQNLIARKTNDGTSVYNSPPTQADLQYIWLKFTLDSCNESQYLEKIQGWIALQIGPVSKSGRKFSKSY